jgi:hypothetical protein
LDDFGFLAAATVFFSEAGLRAFVATLDWASADFFGFDAGESLTIFVELIIFIGVIMRATCLDGDLRPDRKRSNRSFGVVISSGVNGSNTLRAEFSGIADEAKNSMYFAVVCQMGLFI